MKHSFLALRWLVPLAAQTDASKDEKLVHESARVLGESLNAADQGVPADIHPPRSMRRRRSGAQESRLHRWRRVRKGRAPLPHR